MLALQTERSILAIGSHVQEAVDHARMVLYAMRIPHQSDYVLLRNTHMTPKEQYLSIHFCNDRVTVLDHQQRALQTWSEFEPTSLCLLELEKSIRQWYA